LVLACRNRGGFVVFNPTFIESTRGLKHDRLGNHEPFSALFFKTAEIPAAVVIRVKAVAFFPKRHPTFKNVFE
jgi:hypothetical protein